MPHRVFAGKSGLLQRKRYIHGFVIASNRNGLASEEITVAVGPMLLAGYLALD